MILVMTLGLALAAIAGSLALSSQAERQIASSHRAGVSLGYAAESLMPPALTMLRSTVNLDHVPTLLGASAVSGSSTVAARTAALNASLANRYDLGGAGPRWYLADASDRHALWIRDDAGDGDGDPQTDANGHVILRAEAWSGTGAVRAIEVSVIREPEAIRMLAWREVWR